MTRKEVHDLMENELRCIQRGNYCDRDCAKCPLVREDKELIEAYEYVIKLLEQESCEDWCDVPSDEMTLEQARQAVKDLRKKLAEYLEQELNIKNDLGVLRDILVGRDALVGFKQGVDNIRALPSVTPQEPRKGHWIGHREHCENLGVMPSGLGAYEWCSECDCGIDVREWHRNHYNFCPNCGAEMSEVKE